MLVIADASTDNTKQVIEGYIEKFRKKGFKLIYQYQENQGQAVAMDAGLKLITGDYFIWP